MSSDAPTEIGKRDCERTPERGTRGGVRAIHGMRLQEHVVDCERTSECDTCSGSRIHQRGSILSGEYIIWVFHLLEAFAFILPALPADIQVRLFILCIYWVGHYFHLQTAYVKLKREYIKVK
jgi:hypothetical protein